ncbi:transamidase [Holotrichia oblita]|uniref:Transamidase n=1 Tax=Holotrichia oblita TaxID=644536 RepID=A0ACB9TEA4_HOLOL|nr:transamidase [Holotrichia oblita]
MDRILSLNIRLVNKLLQDNVISSTELINACLERARNIKKYNPFITITDNVAIKQADASTDRYNKKKTLSELDGLPIAIKDNFCTENIKTTCASKMLENFIPKYNATPYAKLKNAGAILIGKTNLDQFAMGSGTVDSIYGPTKNIWGYSDDNDFFITGGSSGGSAIAVATGTCYALPPANKMTIKGLKIGIPIEYHCEHLSPDVLDVWDDVANVLEESGAIIKEVDTY